MTANALLTKLLPFKDRQIIDCIDQISKVASSMNYSVNVMDPEFNNSSINEDCRRLNVRTDKNSVITSFTIG